MNYSTKSIIVHIGKARLHMLVVISCLALALLGRIPESWRGWVACPSSVVVVAQKRRYRLQGSRAGEAHLCQRAGWEYLRGSWQIAAMRYEVLWVMCWLSGQQGPAWVGWVPWVLWLWQGAGVALPWLRRQPEWRALGWLLWQVQRLLLVGYSALGLGALLRHGPAAMCNDLTLGWAEGYQGRWALGLGCLVCGGEEPSVAVAQEQEGGYQVTLCGHFTLHVRRDDPFRQRLLILFLHLLEVPGQKRSSRRTREGRTPFVRQQQLAAWFKVPQPDISRWENYWLKADWRRLLSLHTAEVLTLELQSRIVQVLATFPWWRMERVHQHLREQGIEVSLSQVRQAAQESGWSQLRHELVKRYHLTAESIRPQEDWLVSQLLAQIETLLARLEQGMGLRPEEQAQVGDLLALAAEAGMVAQPPLKALPWLLRVERVLFGHWEEVTDGQVRCIYCGSTQVVRKSRKPRLKKYYDSEGNLQSVEVYRYYCRNKACDKASFTNLPPGLVPYSPYRLETHLLAVQMYAWGYSTYRRTAQALGVKSMTVYRWVSALGTELLPMAALFGVVKSSGVVGVDEKYVLVPKNDKPEGDMRRWMYVYFAVDVYTYDLLHIAIYPDNDKLSAHAFLLALKAKGYNPRVIVTDQRQDYGPLIARVFPKARHHECIFHALQNVQEHLKEVYGTHYAQTDPQAEELKQRIYKIFEAKTKRTAWKRYTEIMALRERYVEETPAAGAIFDFLERHWPKLVNAVESDLIPTTNNSVELVIRRFDQHYQNFCGFESIETAHIFLAVFEKVYRFTPFSEDAQPRIRGKRPLELAGYDLSQVPLAAICAGWAPDWPLEVAQELVPNR